jgi:hypothetical protein
LSGELKCAVYQYVIQVIKRTIDTAKCVCAVLYGIYFAASISHVSHSPCMIIVALNYALFIHIYFSFAVSHIGNLFVLFPMCRFVTNLCYVVWNELLEIMFAVLSLLWLFYIVVITVSV